tara:strand:+ start:9306 stop:10058 length:753 start_codon:yes stop_codon:yes gene_type:complete
MFQPVTDYFKLFLTLINWLVFTNVFFVAKRTLKKSKILRNNSDAKAKQIVAIMTSLLTLQNCFFYYYFEPYTIVSHDSGEIFRNILYGYFIYDLGNVMDGYKNSMMDKFYILHHVTSIMCLRYNLAKFYMVRAMIYAEISNLPLYIYKFMRVNYIALEKKHKEERENDKDKKEDMIGGSKELWESRKRLLAVKKVEIALYGFFRVVMLGKVLFDIFRDNKMVPLPFYSMIIIYFCGVYYSQKLWKTRNEV